MSSRKKGGYSCWFWGIVCISLVIRIGFILVISPRMDAEGTLSVDASSYHEIAQNLVERKIFTSAVDPPYNPELPSTFRPPLTPIFLAAVYQMAGANLFWGCMGLAVISAISCGLTYLLGERLFGRAVGVLAGMICCIYPFFLLLVHLPLTEGLSIFLLLVLLNILSSPHSKGNFLLRSVAVGVIFGLLMLNKAANIVVFPCVVLWTFWKRSFPIKRRIIMLLTIIAVAGLVILPWTVRNYRIIGMLVPVNSNGGWTFYLGNNLHTEENLQALEQGMTNGWIPPEEVFTPFADLSFTDIAAYEKRAVRLALGFIRENPLKFCEFAGRKLGIFWSAYSHILDRITWYPIAICSLIGLGYSRRTWKDNLVVYLLLLSSMMIPLVFTSMPRFRAPIMPFIIIYASLGIVNIGQMIRSKVIMSNRS